MTASVKMKRVKVKKGDSAQQPPSAASLLRWYDRHRRAMPWRASRGETPDPYRVWLSEVMLQQTTVATVGTYFEKFTARWATLDALAAASLDDVLKMWAGLGYYRRARMLHRCARKLRDDYDGVFPQDEKALLSLPGFGAYTAAAVRAIAFDRPANVIDGNVERVISRLFAIQDALPQAKVKIRAAAATLVPPKRCGDYAQALMDLGATICTPRSPRCALCPWQQACQAYALAIQETLPRRIKAKPKPTRRAVAFVLFNPKGEILIRRRPAEGLLASMMEVPSSPWREGALPELAALYDAAPRATVWRLLPGGVTHVFTHFTLEIGVAVGHGSGRGHWLAPPNIDREALPSVMKKIIRFALLTTSTTPASTAPKARRR
jgi:A/G-specific adenine glycosylase